MRLGMWIMPLHPPGRPYWHSLAEDIEKSLLADRLGFQELWVGEHISVTAEPIASPLMFLSSLIPRTHNLTFGTAAIILPNHHPVIVAAEAAQFDHMSKGRFMMGVASGALVSDIELFKIPDAGARNRMVLEALKIITGIWTQDPPYEFEGEFWNVRLKDRILADLGIGYLPKPFRAAGPPISVAVASVNSSWAHAAAQHGWGMLSGNTISTAAVASHWAVYSKISAEAGRTPSGENWRVSRNVLVAASDAEARDWVFGMESANRFFYTYLHNAQRALGVPNPMSVEAMIEEYAIFGSARTVFEKLIAFREQVGPFGSLLVTGLDWNGPNEAWERESMRLLAEDVMPKLRRHVTT
jgi:alkanesulfonate monooxygenase SsuD/methylene tetrahydromethanopterin reductase-like flavin-dependent oxidoreductase (luciferase family)